MKSLSQKLLLLVPALCFTALVIVLAISLGGSHEAQSSDRVGDAVPAFSFALLESDQGSFTPAQKIGRPYFINFFASWCLPCRAEHAVLEWAVNRHHIPVIGIAYKDERKDTLDMLKLSGNPFTLVAADPTGRGGIEWGLRGVPETFLIDARGIIRWHYVGPMPPSVIEDDLMRAWKDVGADDANAS